VTTNAAGLDWLRRHYPNHRVHEMLFYEPDPVHIDATFVVIRPGLAISNPDRKPLLPEMLELFKINGWEIIESAMPARSEKSKFSFCSVWLAMNTLMLDENTICIEEGETHLLDQFDKLGFDVIPVPFWEVGPFGGGLHCATADVYREGVFQDYFPKQIPGY
jgi:glycine amidinotransferase